MKRITEAQVERHLVKRVKQLGGQVRKVRWIGRRDAPDRFVMFPYGRHAGHYVFNCWAELKRPGEKARPSQLREHELMRAHGVNVVVFDSFEAIDKYLGFAS